MNALQKTFELVRIGPRQEQIDAVRGQIVEARGSVDVLRDQLANTIIRAPVTGTILERAVEKGEFVTTSFVGERGAKGYVVSLADLNDLEVELDISQNDFAKLGPQQKGIVTTDAFPDRKYEGFISEISPEANRQKATVQVKVKIREPGRLPAPRDERQRRVHLRREAAPPRRSLRPSRVVSTSRHRPIKDNAVFVLLRRQSAYAAPSRPAPMTPRASASKKA